MKGMWNDGDWKDVQIVEVRDGGVCGIFRVIWFDSDVCSSSSSDFWGDDPSSAKRFCLLGRNRLRGGSCNTKPCDEENQQGHFGDDDTGNKEDYNYLDSPVIMGFASVIIGGIALACICGCFRVVFLQKLDPEPNAEQKDAELGISGAGSPKSPSKRRSVLWSPPKRSPPKRKTGNLLGLKGGDGSSLDDSFSHSFPVVQDLSLAKYRPSLAHRSPAQAFNPLSSQKRYQLRLSPQDDFDEELDFSRRRSGNSQQSAEERRQEQVEAARAADEYQQHMFRLRQAAKCANYAPTQNEFRLQRPKHQRSRVSRLGAREVAGPQSLTRTKSQPKLMRIPI